MVDFFLKSATTQSHMHYVCLLLSCAVEGRSMRCMFVIAPSLFANARTVMLHWFTGGADETVRVWSAQDVASAASAAGTSSTASAPSPKLNHSKYDQVVASHTKSSSVTRLQFSNRNLLLAAGAFNFRNRKR